MSTLVRLKSEIEATQTMADSPEGLKAFREVWASAVNEGRERQDAVIVELRESIKALATENERLEGTAMSAQNHAAELEQAKSRAEAELSRVKTQIEGERKHATTALAEATTPGSRGATEAGGGSGCSRSAGHRFAERSHRRCA